MTSAKITDSLSHKQRQRFLYHFALPSIIFYNCYYFAGMIIHCMFWRNYQNKRIHNVCVLLVRYNSSYKLCIKVQKSKVVVDTYGFCILDERWGMTVLFQFHQLLKK